MMRHIKRSLSVISYGKRRVTNHHPDNFPQINRQVKFLIGSQRKKSTSGTADMSDGSDGGNVVIDPPSKKKADLPPELPEAIVKKPKEGGWKFDQLPKEPLTTVPRLLNSNLSLEEEISALKAKIEGYEEEYENATTSEDKRYLGQLITASRTNLHDLYQQQQNSNLSYSELEEPANIRTSVAGEHLCCYFFI